MSNFEERGGVKKKWYTIEITYDSLSEGKNATSLFRIPNMSPQALQQFREGVFTAGAYRRIDDDTGEVISPWNIRSIIIYKQAHFFNAQEEDKPLVKSAETIDKIKKEVK